MKTSFSFFFTFSEWMEKQHEDIVSFFEIDREITDNEYETLCDIMDQNNLESFPYGIHDVGGGETIIHNGEKYISPISFMSYEVEYDQVDNLMKIWKDIISSNLNIKTGDIYQANTSTSIC